MVCFRAGRVIVIFFLRWMLKDRPGLLAPILRSTPLLTPINLHEVGIHLTQVTTIGCG